MRTTRKLRLGFLILLAGLAGCNSGYHSGSGVPTILVSPTSATAGSPDLTLTITGSNGQQFQNANHNRSQAFWSVNGSENLLATSFVSNTMLTAVVPAALLSNPVTAQVLVETGDPEGSLPLAKSNAVSFNVTASQGQGLKISVSPTNAKPGSPDLTLTITASDGQFANNGPHNRSVAVWSVNGSENLLATTFVNSTTLTAVVPAALLSKPVTAQVFVETGDLAGSLPLPKSNSVDFNVGGPFDY